VKGTVPTIAFLVVAATVALPAVGRPEAGIPRCRATQLRLVAGHYGAAATQFTQTLTFTNQSAKRCQLTGWPSLRVMRKLGRVEATRIIHVVQGPPTAPPFRRVVLRPTGAASFNVYGADWDLAANSPCPKTSALRVRPPGDRHALDVRVSVPNCGRLLVAPLIPGRRDRDSWSRVWKA
jgi:hypothetical protein